MCIPSQIDSHVVPWINNTFFPSSSGSSLRHSVPIPPVKGCHLGFVPPGRGDMVEELSRCGPSSQGLDSFWHQAGTNLTAEVVRYAWCEMRWFFGLRRKQEHLQLFGSALKGNRKHFYFTVLDMKFIAMVQSRYIKYEWEAFATPDGVGLPAGQADSANVRYLHWSLFSERICLCFTWWLGRNLFCKGYAHIWNQFLSNEKVKRKKHSSLCQMKCFYRPPNVMWKHIGTKSLTVTVFLLQFMSL